MATRKLRNDSDSAALALMKRVPGDIIEARQEDLIPVLVFALVSLVAEMIIITILWIEDDVRVRGNEVEFLLGHFD